MKEHNMTPLGKEIKKRLIDKNMTQTELAQVLGIQKQYLSKIVFGVRSGDKYLVKICELLDIDLEKMNVA